MKARSAGRKSARAAQGAAERRKAWLVAAILLTVAAGPGSLLLPPPCLAAEQTGGIQGRVTTPAGRPLAYASVLILRTSWGAMTLDDGTYRIEFVPPGSYSVQASMMGCEDVTRDSVRVVAGRVTNLSFQLAETVLDIGIPEVEVTASRRLIRDKASSTIHEVRAEDLASLPVDEFAEAINLKAGVVARGGQLHFRGGRSGEVLYQIDGVPVRDPLRGGSVALATLAVAESEVMLGGLDAQYGNAQSGVVNYRTKEGGERFSGELRYITDDYGAPSETYDNFDRIFLGGGGPTPIPRFTYYVSFEGTWMDNFPPTQERRDRRTLLNVISVGERKSNILKFQGKLAYRSGSNFKISWEAIANRSKSDSYYHMWSRDGWVQTFLDTVQTGEVVLRHGRWSPVCVDSTYVYYNAAEHTPDRLNTFFQQKIVFSHSLTKNAFYSVKLSQQHFYTDTRVQGKKEWEYEGERERDFWFNYADAETSPFFVVSGDYPLLSTRDTRVHGGMFDFTHCRRAHTFQTGVEIRYNDMRYFEVTRPFQENEQGQIGGQRTRYHYYNPEGSFYIQDRWEHEGMVINGGVRYDLFDLGDQVFLAETREPTKAQWSPRIGIAYPISDRDVFSFHYGRFYQIPDRSYIFDDRDVWDSGVRGNPDLTNETTVSYQAGIQHLFSDILVGQMSVYYKDMFGLITTERFQDYSSTSPVLIWVNRDYASAKGVELTLLRRFSNYLRYELSYTYGRSTGTASDPDAAVARSFLYLPTSEQPLDWDVRHSVSTMFYIADPGSWGVNLVWNYSTGFPFTPYGLETRRVDPEFENSRRLPSTAVLDVQAEKYYDLWSWKLKIFLQGRNVLDAKNITNLAPFNWPPPPSRSDYIVYYTETGKAGGAYLAQGLDGDEGEGYVPLHDPRVFASPRAIRVGIGIQF